MALLSSFTRSGRRLLLAAPLLLAGCGHALPDIPGFAAPAWRADRYACAGRRAALLPPLLAARPRLYEARANDVTALLGPPDEEELLANTEKAYHYYLVPGPQCGPRRPHTAGPRLRILFGPLGTVTEVQADPVPLP
ncbi:hypothetical protein GCM10023172_15880 [Hymenobacter ginsengisoli]|uniref:Lipoprotein n=1 Tax=Hymenobacter ginsengisoli TaxID=1051626 RepID=A0ABP8Q8R7_9BACT|nr:MULTISPECIES: hypothetical protein [unclassified Hymenobacter]MBO2030868.1 hypothetical protein [Hymenobacter sp. BT559]